MALQGRETAASNLAWFVSFLALHYTANPLRSKSLLLSLPAPTHPLLPLILAATSLPLSSLFPPRHPLPEQSGSSWCSWVTSTRLCSQKLSSIAVDSLFQIEFQVDQDLDASGQLWRWTLPSTQSICNLYDYNSCSTTSFVLIKAWPCSWFIHIPDTVGIMRREVTAFSASVHLIAKNLCSIAELSLYEEGDLAQLNQKEAWFYPSWCHWVFCHLLQRDWDVKTTHG